MTEEVIVVTTTAGSDAQAETIAAALLDQGLAACVQMTPIESRYVWKGAREAAREVLLIAKSTRAAYPKLEAAIRAAHTYEEPEILATPATGSVGYLAWVIESVRP